MAEPELFVICTNCGSEVSPYVTECPYCGTRLRKRAPKLERRGDELAAKEKRRRRARSDSRTRSSSPWRSSFGARRRSRAPQYGHSVTYGLTSDPQLLQTTLSSGVLTYPRINRGLKRGPRMG